MDLDDLHRLRHARRRDVAPKVTRGGILTLRLVITPRQWAAGSPGRRGRSIEQRGQHHAETGGELLQHHGGGAALTPFDERDHRTAHAALAGQCVEREGLRGAQVAHALGDALIEDGRRFSHGGRSVQNAGYGR